MEEEAGNKAKTENLTTTQVVHAYLNKHGDFEKAMTVWGIEIEQKRNEIELKRNDDEAIRASLTALTTYAGSAVRSSILLNGGAAVALLAFLAHVIASGGPGDRAFDELTISQMVRSLGGFAIGALFGGVAVLCALIAQLSAHNISVGGRRASRIASDFAAWIGIILIGLSFVSFGIGCWYSGWGLAKMLSST
jgi:hypothetical protein